MECCREKCTVSLKMGILVMNDVVSHRLGRNCGNKLEVFFSLDVLNKINENGSEMMEGKWQT